MKDESRIGGDGKKGSEDTSKFNDLLCGSRNVIVENQNHNRALGEESPALLQQRGST